MSAYLSMLAAFMNDEWYRECREPVKAQPETDRFMAMLACFMNDERYLEYR